MKPFLFWDDAFGLSIVVIMITYGVPSLYQLALLMSS